MGRYKCKQFVGSWCCFQCDDDRDECGRKARETCECYRCVRRKKMDIKVSKIHTAMKLMDEKRGASWEPLWVDMARRRGERVQMQERDYWINYTNRVSCNRKFTLDEWQQVKIFNLPKKNSQTASSPRGFGRISIDS